MTVSTTQVRVSYNGDGTTVNFPVPFPFYLSTDLLVLLNGTKITSGYSVSGGNGSIGVLAMATAPTASPLQVLTIILNVPLTQLVNLVDGTAFPSATMNQVNDRVIQAALRLQDQMSRTVRAPDGDLSPGMLLPPAASRAGLFLGFDGAGNALLTSAGAGTANTLATLGPILNPQTSAESLAGVTPTNYAYPQGHFWRYGADPTGTLSSDTALLRALAVASSNGGLEIQVPPGIYKFTSNTTFNITNGAQIVGTVDGPFDGFGTPPNASVQGPTFLVTNTATPFLTLYGWMTKIRNILVYYPNQVAPTAATPTVYPYTITCKQGGIGGWEISGCTIVNAYNAVDAQSGRGFIVDCFIGAFKNDIQVDHCTDWLFIDNVECSVFWDTFAGLSFPQNIDAWVLTNGTAIATYRVDGLQVNNFSVYARFTGHFAGDSSDGAQTPTCGYGRFSNVDFDFVGYGVNSNAANNSGGGFKYTNIDIGANQSGVGVAGQAIVHTFAGGSVAPLLTAETGSIRGTWAAGSYPISNNSGKIYAQNLRGLNPFGSLTPPSVPATGVAATNSFAFPVRVFIFPGTATILTISINASGVGNQIMNMVLMPYDTITISYTGGPPTWAWFGM